MGGTKKSSKLAGANSAANREQKLDSVKKDKAGCPLEEGFPPIFIDAHMHIQSGGCAPLPPLHARMGGFNLSRSTIDYWSDSWIARLKTNIGEISVLPTDTIGDRLVNLNNGLTHLAKRAAASYLGQSVVLTMDMDYCHIDGYEGLQVYFHEDQGPKKGQRYYLKRDSGTQPRREAKKVYVDWQEDLPLDVIEFQHNILVNRTDPKKTEVQRQEYDAKMRADRRATLSQHAEREFEKNNPPPMPSGEYDFNYAERYQAWEDQKRAYIGTRTTAMEARLDEALANNDTGIDVTDQFLRELGGSLHETWAQQVLRTERAAVANPLRMLPMYHFDPRRYVDGGASVPFTYLVPSGGVYIGIKMYTSQGYMPKEDTAAGAKVGQILQSFFAQCAGKEVPIMAHCTPAGFFTHQRDLYIDLAAPGVKAAYTPAGAKGPDDKGRLQYFQQKFVHPEAWRPVLAANPSLRLCLAHFASDKVLWKDDPADLDKQALTAAQCRQVQQGMAQFNSDRKSWGRFWRGIGDPKDLLDAYWSEKSPFPGCAKPSIDANGTFYEKGWIRSMVELCTTYTNFHTDISYLPLFEKLERSSYDPCKDLVYYWQVLAEILRKRPAMIDKIMFGSDWYMILLDAFLYRDWFDKTIEALENVRTTIGSEQDLFHQFAIVNPARFYRLDKIAGNLHSNLEKKIASARGIDKQKARQALARNYDTLRRLKEGPGKLTEMIPKVKKGPLFFTNNPLPMKPAK